MPENAASYRVVRKKSYLFNKAHHRRWRFFGASLFNPGHRVFQCRICLFRYILAFLQYRL
ncbi:hypothetical protein GCS61_16935 [Escherichia coli]|nr:hypothetical protein [Escherichia coli]EFH9333502.1 hypothetical protein [Escherichia coli]